MPKVSTVPTSNRPSLRRNQACLSCRKRKLKCDAGRPHCGTCVKQWQTQISVPPPPGYTHPTEPQCSYDPVEGLPLAPDIDPAEKIRELEEQVAILTRKLKGRKSSDDSRDGSCSPSHLYSTNNTRAHSMSLSPSAGFAVASSHIESDMQPIASNTIALPQASLEMNTLPIDRLITNDSAAQHIYANGRAEPLKELIQTGWNSELPSPTSLMRYIEVFFKCDPCASRVLHRPSFMSSLRLHPKNPDFPHSAILHAICASASRWISKDVTILPDGTRRDRFAEFHSRKTREYIDRTMASGVDIFQVMQACILLSWYFYFEGRWVEVWIFAGFQTRVAVPLRLNYQGTFAAHNSSSPGAYLAPPKNTLDLELRRRAWWMTVMFDRMVSVGGWVHALDERDIGTELPLRGFDFELNQEVGNNYQHLWSPNLYTEHPPQFTDSFILLLKAMMLFGRITDFNVRTNLRAPPNKLQDPFLMPDFMELDRLVAHDFLSSLPPEYRNFLSFGEVDSVYNNGGLDTDLYMVHMVPHAATITLHNPYLDFKTVPQNLSTTRCVEASRSILSLHYALTATSYDTTRLHPFATICWYLAAVVQIQRCKDFIERGDTQSEYEVWGEINVLRFAMAHYGQRSPIGTRQEKLLQGLMSEIVRMTTQQQPLEVGIPLYPFSRASAFAKGEGEEVLGAHIAPLPVSPPYQGDLDNDSPERPSISPQLSQGVLTQASQVNPTAWVMTDLSHGGYE